MTNRENKMNTIIFGICNFIKNHKLRTVSFISFIIIILFADLIYCNYIDQLLNMGLISNEYLITHFLLNSTNPTLSGIFLSSYSHNPNNFTHIYVNLICFALISIIIGIIWIWKLIDKNPLPKGFIIFTYGIIMIIFPFIISEVCLIISSISLNQFTGFGLSGICFALVGVLIFLSIPCFISILRNDDNNIQKSIKCTKITRIIFIIVISISLLFFGFGYPTYSGIAHMSGFLLGIALAFILEKYLPRHDTTNDENHIDNKESSKDS